MKTLIAVVWKAQQFPQISTYLTMVKWAETCHAVLVCSSYFRL
jgi:hypothetical protein